MKFLPVLSFISALSYLPIAVLAQESPESPVDKGESAGAASSSATASLRGAARARATQAYPGLCYTTKGGNDDAGLGRRDLSTTVQTACTDAFLNGCNLVPSCALSSSDAYNLASTFCNSFTYYPFPNEVCPFKYECC